MESEASFVMVSEAEPSINKTTPRSNRRTLINRSCLAGCLLENYEKLEAFRLVFVI